MFKHDNYSLAYEAFTDEKIGERERVVYDIFMKKSIFTALFCLILTSFSAHAQAPIPPTDSLDIATDLTDGIHQPVMKSYGRLGYQIDVFGERLRLPGTEIEEITAGGVLFHNPRIGGMYRMPSGPLKDAYVYMDYTFMSQPVFNQRTEENFTRSTHFLDAGVGYFFKLVEDRVELAPFLGMSSQFNLNDINLENQNIYYHANQSRLGFGLGAQLAVRFDDTLPFPLFLFINAAAYPFTPVITDAVEAEFPENLTVLHFNGSFYGRFLPYLGAEAGYRQQFHFGSSAQSQFDAAWGEFFLLFRFEPEILWLG